MWERISEEELVKRSECALSCWLVFPAARKRRERMCSVMLPGLSCCLGVKSGVCALSCWLACPTAGQWGSEKRENVPSHVGWSVLLLASEETRRECALSRWLVCPTTGQWGNEKRENVPSHVGWSVLLLGGEEREYVLCHVGWLVLLLASGEARRGWELVSVAFYADSGRMASVNLIGRNI